MPAPQVRKELIRAYLEEGRGMGHGESYLAFIQLKRWNASPVSVQTAGVLPPFARQCHFLSRSEWLIALLLAWAGCHIREQFPMWPWEANHPLHGLDDDLDARLAKAPGTLDLCREADIRHGVFVGTNIPYIWTLDLVATQAWLPRDELGASVVSVKPLESEKYTGDIDPLARGPEKLEIERRFCSALSLPYFVADRTLYPGELLGQLELYSAAARIPDGHPIARAQDQLLHQHGHSMPATPPVEWRDRLVADYGLNQSQATYAVHNMFWHQRVDVDLSSDVDMESPIRPGGHVLRTALRSAIRGAM